MVNPLIAKEWHSKSTIIIISGIHRDDTTTSYKPTDLVRQIGYQCKTKIGFNVIKTCMWMPAREGRIIIRPAFGPTVRPETPRLQVMHRFKAKEWEYNNGVIPIISTNSMELKLR